MLKFKNVQQNFGQTKLRYPDWKIAKGSQAMILGGSGSGKTTLLHIATGLLIPSQGEVTLGGKIISKMKAGELDKFRGRTVGMIFQKPHLVKSLSVEENITLAGRFNGQNIKKDRINHVLETLGIGDLNKRRPYELSEGQAQRVSIVRAVIHQPALLAADEPTASLDDENCEKVISLLKSQAEKCGATLLIATHDQRVKEAFTNLLEL